MGEVVAWGLGLGLGYTVSNMLTTRSRIVLFVLAIVLLGASITVLSGEMTSEPWLVVVDIAQVAVAASIGVWALPLGIRWLRRRARPVAR
jgi:general stress protein CsbA